MRPEGSDFTTDGEKARAAAAKRRYQAQSGAVRIARQRAGMTQRDLASIIGVPTSVIARAERGDRDTRVTTIGRIARATGVPLETLLAFEPLSE